MNRNEVEVHTHPSDDWWQEVRGSLSDAQYGLLLSVIGQNFSERLVCDDATPRDLGQSMLHLPQDSHVMDNLSNILQTAKDGSGSFGLNAVYNVQVALVEVVLELAEDLDTEHGTASPLMLATGRSSLSLFFPLSLPLGPYISISISLSLTVTLSCSLTKLDIRHTASVRTHHTGLFIYTRTHMHARVTSHT